MSFIQLHPVHIEALDRLLMVLLRPLGGHSLKAMHRLDIDCTAIGCALVAYAPALTFEPAFDLLFGQLAVAHQRTGAFGKLAATPPAAQPFNRPRLARPRTVTNIALAGLIEIGSSLILS